MVANTSAEATGVRRLLGRPGFLGDRRDIVRTALYRWGLGPAGRRLPRTAVRAFAWPLAGVLVGLEGFRGTGWRHLREAYEISQVRAIGVFWAQQAGLLVEHGFVQGALVGHYRADQHQYRVLASAEAQAVLDGPGSVIIASGHFMRDAALFAVFAPQGGRRPMAVITANLPDAPRTATERRVQDQLGTALDGLEAWSMPRGTIRLPLGGAAVRAVRALRESEIGLWVNIDAPWPEGRGPTVTVPFAADTARTFSTGTAKIARTAGCPILLLLPEPQRGRQVTLRVLGPYTSDAAGGSAQDEDVTAQVLRDIEVQVGRRPSGYILDVGHGRRWDPDQQAWVEKPTPA
ncbi:hypothetical protein [Isoptericola sp. NPDC055881]